MAQVVTRLITTRRARPLGRIALLVLMLAPVSAPALVQPSLRDLSDPVAPGGIIPYRITLSDQTADTPAPPTCFNPPAECVTYPVSCRNAAPVCTGNEAAGFVCQNSFNDGANCGVGTPPVADPTLCIDEVNGVCNGGPNINMPCAVPDGSLTTECPGFTFLCRRSFNEDAYCGTTPVASTPQCVGDVDNGFTCINAANNGASCTNAEGNGADDSICEPVASPQPQPENDFCLSNPTGICSGGPNFGLVCTAAHGFPTAECPPATTPVAPTNVLVELPIPPFTSFIDADNGGTSNGSIVSWTIPPMALCGGVGEPVCPQLNARLLVDTLVTEGTVFQNTATATDQDGFLISGVETTLVARFVLRTLALAYPANADARDRFIFRARFALTATETINPGFENFHFNLSTDGTTIVDFDIPSGQFPESGIGTWSYFPPTPGLPGLKNARIKLIGPGLYAIRMRATQMTLPGPTSLNATVTMNVGDDTFTHVSRLLVKRGGQRYVAARSTTTTTIISPPTTTTSIFGATTTSTSITTSSTIDVSTTTSTVASTTSTTLAPCGDIGGGVCGGSCPVGETCGGVAPLCACLPDVTTTTSSTTSSTLESSTTTSSTVESSTTTSTTLAPCGDIGGGVCGGSCPVGQTCNGVAPLCVCLPDVTTTSSTLEPTTTTSSTLEPTTTTSSTLEPTTTTSSTLEPTTTTSSTLEPTTTTSSTLEPTTTTSSTLEPTTTTSSTLEPTTTTSSSTTSTTLGPCGDIGGGVCGGTCVIPGETCQDVLGTCLCTL